MPALSSRLPWRPYLVLIAVAAGGLLVPFVGRSQSEWDAVYVATAADLLAGTDIYDAPRAFTYPPAAALVGLPAVGLPNVASRVGWWAANVAALAVLLRAGWRLAGGSRLDTAGRREHVAAWLGLLAGLPFLLNALGHHQTDVLLAALVVAGVERLSVGRWYTAATLLGLAAAVKCTPLLFAPYLLLRRKPGPAGWLLAVAVAANLLPDLVSRPADGSSVWLAKWADRYLLPMARPDYAPGIWASEIIYNQSAVGTLNRWTHTALTAADGRLTVESVPPTVEPIRLKRWLAGAAVGCGLLGLAAVLVSRQRGAADPAAAGWDAGLVVAGMLLFSPMSGPAHFGLLVLPGFVLARAAVNGRRGIWVPVGVLLLAAAAANKDLVGGWVYTVGLWAGLPTAAAVAVLVGCAGGLLTWPRAGGPTGTEDRAGLSLVGWAESARPTAGDAVARWASSPSLLGPPYGRPETP